MNSGYTRIITVDFHQGKSGIPSDWTGVLRSLLNLRIIGATRYGWWSPEVFVQKHNIVDAKTTFSQIPGPVAIEVETGLVLGIANDIKLNSIVVWIEKDEVGGTRREQPLNERKDLFPVDALSSNFASDCWHRVIDASIESISVYVRRPQNVLYENRPNQAGLCFRLSTGEKLIFAHSLQSDMEEFVLISDTAISKRVRSELRELSLDELTALQAFGVGRRSVD